MSESRIAQVLHQFQRLVKELSEIEKIPVPTPKDLSGFFEIIEARNLFRMMAEMQIERPHIGLTEEELRIPETDLATIKKAAVLRIWIQNHSQQISSLGGRLRLMGIQLSLLPKEIGLLKGLQQLNLGFNRLVVLPKEIGHLLALTKLELNNNCLVDLPKEIGLLMALEGLDLDNNRLVALLPEISQLRFLVSLNLSYNRLVALPEKIGQLVRLISFQLEGNGLIDLPWLPNILKRHKYELQIVRQNKNLQLQTILHRLTAAIVAKAKKEDLLSLLGKIDTLIGKEPRSRLHRCLKDICNRTWKKGNPLRVRLEDAHFGSKAFLDPTIDPKLKLAAIELLKKQLEQEI